MKIVYALPENLGFMISFNPEAQARMQATETFLQTFINFLVHLPIQAGFHSQRACEFESHQLIRSLYHSCRPLHLGDRRPFHP